MNLAEIIQLFQKHDKRDVTPLCLSYIHYLNRYMRLGYGLKSESMAVYSMNKALNYKALTNSK